MFTGVSGKDDANIVVCADECFTYFFGKKLASERMETTSISFADQTVIITAPSDISKQMIAEITTAVFDIPECADMTLVYTEPDSVELSLYGHDSGAQDLLRLYPPKDNTFDATSVEVFLGIVEALDLLYRNYGYVFNGITADKIFVYDSSIFFSVSVSVNDEKDVEVFGDSIIHLAKNVFQLGTQNQLSILMAENAPFDNVTDYLLFMKKALTSIHGPKMKPGERAIIAPHVAERVYNLDDDAWIAANPKKQARDVKIAAVFGVGSGNGFGKHTKKFDPKTREKPKHLTPTKRKRQLQLVTQHTKNIQDTLGELKQQLSDDWMYGNDTDLRKDAQRRLKRSKQINDLKEEWERAICDVNLEYSARLVALQKGN